MDITIENIADVEIPEDLQNAIFAKLEAKAPTYLGSKGFVVKAQADYDTALTTASEAAVRKAVGEEGAKLYGSIDSLVSIALGETKPDKMRSREWYAQLETAGKLPLTDEAITKIKTAMKGETSATKDAVVEELRAKLQENETKAQKAEQDAFQRTVKTAINADLRNAPVVIDPSLKDATAIATAKNAALSDIKELFNTLYEGKRDGETDEVVYFKKGTDKALVNATENRPLTPTEIIRQNHPMFLAPVGHQQQGAGTGKPAATGGQPGAFTSLAEIRVYAIKTKGLAANSDAYNKFISEERVKAKL